MKNKFERPLDFLNVSKGKKVLVNIKGDKQIVGNLLAFDLHINLVLENAKFLENGEIRTSLGLVFLKGETVVLVSPSTD